MDSELGLRKKITTHQVRSQYVGLFSVMCCYIHMTDELLKLKVLETESKCMIHDQNLVF